MNPTMISVLLCLETVLAYCVNLAVSETEESTVISGFGCLLVLVGVVCFVFEEKINAKLTEVMAKEGQEQGE